MHGQGHELVPAHQSIRVEVVGAAHLLADEHALLRQAEGGAVGADAVHVGVGHLGGGLFDLHLDRGGLGGVAHGVHRHIGEGVLAGLVLIRGVDELSRAVLGEGDRPPGRLVHQPEGEDVPLRVHSGKLPSHSHILIGGELQVLRDGSAVGGGEEVEPHRHILPGTAVSKDGGEGELGAGHGGGVAGIEPQAGHGAQGHRVSHGHIHAVQGEHAGVGVGQRGEHDGVQRGLSGLYIEIRGGEGEDVGRRAVFGEGGDGGRLRLPGGELGRDGQGHGQGEGGHQGQQGGPAQKTGVFQE